MLCFALHRAACDMGIGRTSVAKGALFGNGASLLLVLWGTFLARTLPRGWQALAVLLALAGAALLMGQSYELAPAYLVGDLFSLLAGVFYTFYVILMQRVRGGLGAWTTLGLSSAATLPVLLGAARSEEHTSELQSLMRISYAVFCLKKKNKHTSYNTLHAT